MSLTNTHDSAILPGATDRLNQSAQGLRARIAAIRARRRAIDRTYRELSELNDRCLSDLGFARCDLRRIARESVDAR